jgi:hypothetical protein
MNVIGRLNLGRCANILVMVAGGLFAGGALAVPVTYTATVVTDVSLKGTMYRQAEVTFTFQGDTGDVATFTVPDPGCTGCVLADVAWITKGRAQVTITSGSRSIVAHFPPGEIFVSSDTYSGGIGFGSTVASGQEPAYPLAMTVGTARDYAEYFDTLTGSDPAVLGTTANVSGNAFSCIGYPDSAPDCNDPTPYPLKTDKGNLIVFQPYIDDSQGAEHGSMNRAVFQIALGSTD